MESFIYQYPVKNYFGEGALEQALAAELPFMGAKVMLAYGGGSIKRTGLYDEVVRLLTEAGKEIVEFAGIMPNPTYEKVQEGAKIAREHEVDAILAVGGGSVFDCCKIVSAQAKLDEDIHEYEHEQGKMPTEFIPLACVVTLSGTGAEQNNGGVITDEVRKVKGPFIGALPAWAALDPAYTLTVPSAQFMSGAFDSLSHCMETYFGTPRERCVSDDINFAVQRNIIRNMRAVAADENDLHARSELVYDSAMGENGVLKIGKVGDFQCHMIQHQYGAYTHTNHGLGLGIIHPHLYRHLAPAAPEQFARWAVEVWGVDPAGKDDLAVALEGIDALAAFIKEMGMPTTFAEFESDASDGTLRAVADTAVLTAGCAKKLTPDEIFEILVECR
ncbi:iron-containing alcohol dehydrogenase [Adlercreutzia equolifaciens]|uniref:iron-containing alcohol dehydrogenase n=1 Tax=Adlercreutzia equolifaciens TaxID=446660 RepID=UPI0023B0089A|nr:iron-containing alcohol dehydrogenase [Adlercreutzia equolifaciens]MDE8701374.1 iron-containing alcohol dehydrogenase [Adlercreutzia equolifaciens]